MGLELTRCQSSRLQSSHWAPGSSSGPAHSARGSSSALAALAAAGGAGPRTGHDSGPSPRLRAPAPAGPAHRAAPHPPLLPRGLLLGRQRPALCTMAGLLALLSPAGRVGARVRCRATWLLGAAAHCVPPPVFLPLLGPGPDAQLLRAARGNYQGRQVSLPTPTRFPGHPDPRTLGSLVHLRRRRALHAQLLRPNTFRSPDPKSFQAKEAISQLTTGEIEAQGGVANAQGHSLQGIPGAQSWACAVVAAESIGGGVDLVSTLSSGA